MHRTEIVFSRFAPVALATALLLPFVTHADHLPRWEVGAGAGGVDIPDYRGSNESRAYVAPFPVGVYRGDRVAVDRRGLRTLLYASGKFAINASADFALPLDSNDNAARADMPDLDFLLQLGPSFEYTVHREPDDRDVARLKLPVFTTVALDLSEPYTHGWFVYPHFNYSIQRAWSFGGNIGFTWASRGFHDYYYSVAPRYENSGRAAYNADAGYSGLRASAATSRRFGDKWFGVFVRYENYRDSAFEDSPLVKEKENYTWGVGLTWFFYQSTRRAADSPLTEPDTM